MHFGPGPGWGPYGPGPYAPLWAHMGPYGRRIPIQFLFDVSVLISGFRFLFLAVSILIFNRFNSYLAGVFGGFRFLLYRVSVLILPGFGSYFSRFGSYLARVKLGPGLAWPSLSYPGLG